MSGPWRGLIDRYGELLPVTGATPVVTLNEGWTPLIPAPKIAKKAGVDVELYLKYEGANPTGSFKDRGMTLAVSKACEDGARALMCASTGNTSASAAAYAARAGIDCFVLIPSGMIALGKLSQALVHGAKVIAVRGNFDKALELAIGITGDHAIVLVNSLNPHRIEGQKTGAFEICDQLEGRAPDVQVMPVGNAGNITAYWAGYKQYRNLGRVGSAPRMMGFQAEGAAPIVRKHVVERPETIATAIRIGNPASWKRAEAAAAESGGRIDMVSDKEIISAYRLLASGEGVFAEPASAASVAGFLKLAARGEFTRGDTVVCILTGAGLKDPDCAINVAGKPVEVPAERGPVLEAMGYE